MIYSVSFKTKWADFDANKHMRHTAYNDYAAECRISFFREHGLSAEFFESENFGPILFEENTSFRREIKMGESLTIDMALKASSKHAERFKILHHVYKEDGTLAAKISVFIALFTARTIPPFVNPCLTSNSFQSPLSPKRSRH